MEAAPRRLVATGATGAVSGRPPMNASNYLIWGRDYAEGTCSLAGMTGYPESWKLLDGHPLVGQLPPTTRLAMTPDRPGDHALTDSLYNLDKLIVASPKLRALLEALALPNVEFLEVAVFDHAGAPVAEPYVIVHPTAPVDALDAEASGADFSLIDPDTIDTVERLVLDASRIPADRLLFRPKGYYDVILAHRDLAARLDAAGVTGIRWIELDAWPEG